MCVRVCECPALCDHITPHRPPMEQLSNRALALLLTGKVYLLMHDSIKPLITHIGVTRVGLHCVTAF